MTTQESHTAKWHTQGSFLVGPSDPAFISKYRRSSINILSNTDCKPRNRLYQWDNADKIWINGTAVEIQNTIGFQSSGLAVLVSDGGSPDQRGSHAWQGLDRTKRRHHFHRLFRSLTSSMHQSTDDLQIRFRLCVLESLGIKEPDEVSSQHTRRPALLHYNGSADVLKLARFT